jgi:hypothetical protein
MRFLIVGRLTENRPTGILAQICVKPRKSNVSGLPSSEGGRLGPRQVQDAARHGCDVQLPGV